MNAGIVERKVNTGMVNRLKSAARSVLRRPETTIDKSPKDDVFSLSVVPQALQGTFLRQLEIEKQIAAHKKNLRSIEVRFSHKDIETLNKETSKVFAYKAKLNHKERELVSQIDYLRQDLEEDHYLSEYLAYHEARPAKKDDDTTDMFVPKSFRKKIASFINKALGLEKSQNSFEEREFDKERLNQSLARMQAIIQRKSLLNRQLESLKETQAPKREKVENYYDGVKSKFGNAYSEWFKIKEQIFNLEEELRNLTGL